MISPASRSCRPLPLSSLTRRTVARFPADRGINPAVCEYHLGHALAPGGYVWVFPKGDDTANVGLVISANHAAEASAQQHLDEFVERVFPGAHILGVVAGGIPATGALKQMVTDGLMVVGDAAHQADPLTAGGINLGMIGADLAAQVGIRALANGGVSARNLRDYPRLWQEHFGAQHSALYKIRKFLTEMDDEHLAQLIHTASTLPLHDMSNGEILFALLKHHPALLLQATTLVTTGLLLK